MATRIPCTTPVHVAHVPGKPFEVADPENGYRKYMRTTCAECDTWLSDGPYLDEPPREVSTVISEFPQS